MSPFDVDVSDLFDREVLLVVKRELFVWSAALIVMLSSWLSLLYVL